MDESALASAYDAIYLSPHLDDAVLSCGGQIHRFVAAGQRVLIVTVAAGDPAEGDLSPLARDLHRQWGLAAEGMALRREEDRSACRVLGAECLHGDALDALYRRHPETGKPFYPSLKSLFAPPDPGDRERVREWVTRLERLPPAARVCAPLGAGRHVDHLLARWAAEGVWGRRLEYYEDYPYARSFWVLRKAVGVRPRWRTRVWPLGPESMAAKCRAIACYRSQLGSAFKDEEEMKRQVVKFSRRVGGERLWYLP